MNYSTAPVTLCLYITIELELLTHFADYKLLKWIFEGEILTQLFYSCMYQKFVELIFKNNGKSLKHFIPQNFLAIK